MRFAPRIAIALLAVALLALPNERPLRAQDVTSPIADLLRAAKDALNDLRYARADTIARDVLARAQLRRSQSVLAWQIVAAANFPEDGARDTVAARKALREVIRFDLDAIFPLDIRWLGLEALFTDEKQRTMGLALRIPRAEIIYGGSAGDAVIRAATSLPTTIWLLARADGGSTEIVVDSAVGTREAVLHIAALRDGTPVLASGAYQFVVRAREPQSGVMLERMMQASVAAAPLLLEPVPARIDTMHMLPVVSTANRRRGIAAGVTMGVVTIALGQFLRSAEPIKSSGSDGKAKSVGFLIAVGTGVGVWFDRGVPLPKNIEANAQLRRVNEQVIGTANAENEKRRVGYRAKITLLAEDK
jgi:hypothetical protein